MSGMPKPHALCKMFPRPTAPQKEEIKHDIKKNGQLKPIVCWRDENSNEWMIDGLTRNTIIDELIAEGVETAENGKAISKEVEWFEGDKAAVFDFVIATNFHRREMNKSQRAALVVLFADMEKKYKGKESGDYARMIAEGVGVNRQYIFDCKNLKENDPESPKLLMRVVSGELKVREALKLLKGEVPTPADKSEPEEVEVLDALKKPGTTPENLQGSERLQDGRQSCASGGSDHQSSAKRAGRQDDSERDGRRVFRSGAVGVECRSACRLSTLRRVWN